MSQIHGNMNILRLGYDFLNLMFAKLFECADRGSGVKIGLGHLIRKIDGALVLPFVPVLKQ